MDTDAHNTALASLAARPPDYLLALAGTLDDGSLVLSTLAALSQSDLVAALDADGALPDGLPDLAALRDRGRRAVREVLEARRAELQALICPVAQRPDVAALIGAVGSAAVHDVGKALDAEPSTALLAIVAYLLTASVQELCADFPGPRGGAAAAIA